MKLRFSGLIAASVVAAAAGLFALGAPGIAAAEGSPTCGGLGGILVHGQHVIGDYVTGLGGIGGGLEWPPSGGTVGEAVSANGGPVIPGGPGPGFHFLNGFAPGASFCVESAHPNGFEAPPHIPSPGRP